MPGQARADLDDRDDAGMRQLGRGLGLAVETLDLLGSGELAALDHLQSNDAIELLLPGLVDDAHPAPINLLQQLVVAEGTESRFSLGRGCFLQSFLLRFRQR